MDINGTQDPAFVRWLRETGQSRPIKPDEQDFDWSVPATTTAEQAHQWRQAQARKLTRLYVVWRASQN